jgi:GDP-D-mannose dehydratase
MGLMIDVLECAAGEDFVLATGRTVHARALVEQLFAKRGASMHDYVIEDTRSTNVSEYAVNIGKLRSVGLWPRIPIEQLIADLVAAA